MRPNFAETRRLINDSFERMKEKMRAKDARIAELEAENGKLRRLVNALIYETDCDACCLPLFQCKCGRNELKKMYDEVKNE